MAAKPISKRIEKKVKKGGKAVEKQAKAARKKAQSVKKKAEKQTKAAQKKVEAAKKRVEKTLSSDKKRSKAKVAGVAAAGVAGIAGIAAAVHYLRRDSEGRAVLHVVAEESEWHITAEGKEEPLGRFPTKEETVEAARQLAQEAAPSDLVIHRLDGSVMRSHSYEPE